MLVYLCDNKVRNSVLKTVSTTVSYSLLTLSTIKSSWYGLQTEGGADDNMHKPGHTHLSDIDVNCSIGIFRLTTSIICPF